MHKKTAAFATILTLLIGSTLIALSLGQSISIRDTSSTIELLKGKIQGGKNPQEVYKITVELLGQPDRDIGSGLQIPQWDLPSGELTYHPSTGPIFADTNGNLTWLINTKHEVGVSIIGSYEMTTLPDSFRTRYWLGDLELRADRTYEYIDSNSNLNERQNQEDNFFINNAKGTYEIGFYNGITGTTLLEGLTDNATIAELKFKAKNDLSNTLPSESFSIYVDTKQRALYLKATTNKGGMYQLEMSWASYSETQ